MSEQAKQPPFYVQRFIKLNDQNGQLMMEKYTEEQILNLLEHCHLDQIRRIMERTDLKFMNPVQFVTLMLNVIDHSPIDTLFLTVGLSKIYREITLAAKQSTLRLEHITNYLCELPQRNSWTVCAKKMRLGKLMKARPVRLSDDEAPPIYGVDRANLMLETSSTKTDKNKHAKTITHAAFSKDLRLLFTLDSLADSILVYSRQCNQVQRLSAGSSKQLTKDVIILAFAFSERQLRIGAVLKSFSFIFWDSQHDFKYQKVVSTAGQCVNLQTSIFFIEELSEWISSEKGGVLSFWDLETQTVKRRIQCKYKAPIIDICSIGDSGIFAVSQEDRQGNRQQQVNGNRMMGIVIYNSFSGQIMSEVEADNSRIPHTIRYSRDFQILFTAALSKTIKMFEIHSQFADLVHKRDLVGHENLIVHFTLLGNSANLASADAKGVVKLWDFRAYECIQNIDYSCQTVITRLVDMTCVGKLALMGSRLNMVDFESKRNVIDSQHSESISVDKVQADIGRHECFIYTPKAVMMLDLRTGVIKYINEAVMNSAENVTFISYFAALRRFLTGNIKGDLLMCHTVTGEVSFRAHRVHSGPIKIIDYDDVSKLIVSAGQDACIVVTNAETGQPLRSIKDNFNGRPLSHLMVSAHHNLLIQAAQTNIIYLWSYEKTRILASIKLTEGYPTCMELINGLGLLVIASSQAELFIIQMTVAGFITLKSILDYRIPASVIHLHADVVWASNQVQRLVVYAGLQSGVVVQIDLTRTFLNRPFVRGFHEQQSFNPNRQGKESFVSQTQKMAYDTFVVSYQQSRKPKQSTIHFNRTLETEDESTETCYFLNYQSVYIAAVHNQCRFRISSSGKNAKLACDFNLNYPLAYKWDLNPKPNRFYLAEIHCALKILHSIRATESYLLQSGMRNRVELVPLIAYVDSLESAGMITEPLHTTHSQPRLLQDHYSKEDLRYDSLKKTNFREVAGPYLKELDRLKKIATLQKNWRKSENNDIEEKATLLKFIRQKARKQEQRQQLFKMLSSETAEKQEPIGTEKALLAALTLTSNQKDTERSGGNIAEKGTFANASKRTATPSRRQRLKRRKTREFEAYIETKGRFKDNDEFELSPRQVDQSSLALHQTKHAVEGERALSFNSSAKKLSNSVEARGIHSNQLNRTKKFYPINNTLRSEAVNRFEGQEKFMKADSNKNNTSINAYKVEKRNIQTQQAPRRVVREHQSSFRTLLCRMDRQVDSRRRNNFHKSM